MMAAVAILALALVDARLATLLFIVTGAAFAVRSLLAGPTAGRTRSWAVPYFVTLACVYLPYAWVLWDFPRDEYRLQWVKLWPVLPGLVAGTFVHPNDAAMTLVSGAVTVLLVVLFTRLGTRGRTALVVTNALALLGCGLGSWFAYQLFLF
jgi:hypothetical protein